MWLSRVARATGHGIVKGILGVVVMLCIGISVFFAFEFGSGKAASGEFAIAYGLAGGGLDLLKAALPMIAATAIVNRQWSRGLLAWVAFIFLTGMSLWCAFGTTAGQLAEKFATQVVAKSGAQEKAVKIKDLRKARDAIGYTVSRTTAGMVTEARAAVDALAAQIETERARGGCKDICRQREADERAARAALLRMQGDKATTDAASDLDQQIADAEAIKVDIKAAAKDIDPQATSISKAFDMSVEKAALIGQIIFAIGVEIGSGLGLWLVFGHGGEPTPARAPVIVISRGPEPVSEEDQQKADRKRFFATCAFNAGTNTAAGVVHGAYLVWCGREGITSPMGVQAFGTRSPWASKRRIGGIVHYVGCGISPTLLPAPSLRVVSRN